VYNNVIYIYIKVTPSIPVSIRYVIKKLCPPILKYSGELPNPIPVRKLIKSVFSWNLYAFKKVPIFTVKLASLTNPK